MYLTMHRIVLLLITAVLLPVASVSAQEVTVQVETSGETALVARSNGLRQAEGAALLKLLEAQLPEKAATIVARIPPEQVGELVSDFEVLQEKSTARQYAAEIRYRFDKEKINRLMAEEQGLIPESDSRALLVIPLWQEGNKLMLWEKENPWRNQMAAIVLQEGRGKLLLPYGDPKDTFILDNETILSGEREAMVALAERYGTKNVVIAQARNMAKEGEPAHIRVLLRRPGAAKQEETQEQHYVAAQPAETESVLLARAAQDIARQLTEATGNYSLFANEEARQVKARVVRAEFRHSREWMQIKKAFEGLPNVEYMDIGAVSPSFAQVTFYFRGSDALIRKALLTRGIEVQDVSDYWQVSLPD